MVPVLETQKRGGYPRKALKLPAIALQYAVVVSFIVFLISSLFLLLYFHNGIIVDKSISRDEMEASVNTAIAQTIASGNSIYGSVTVQIFNDIVTLNHSQLGMYSLLRASTNRGSERVERACIIGSDFSANVIPALWLANNQRDLQVSGKNIIKGDCFVPEHGVRFGMYLNQSFVGEKITDRPPKISKPELPQLPSPITNYISKMVQGVIDSVRIVSADTLQQNDSIINSYWNKTILIKLDKPSSLTRVSLSGNIVVWSPFPITISSQAHLYDITIVAPRVTVASQFRGNVHIIATQSVRVQSKACLLLPSTICLQSKPYHKDSAASLWIDSSARVCGAVVLLGQAASPFHPQPCIYIANSAQVYGLVYSTSGIEMRGQVFGSIFTRVFALRSYEGNYENMLYNSEIDITKLPKSYVGPLWGEFAKRKKMLKYVY